MKTGDFYRSVRIVEGRRLDDETKVVDSLAYLFLEWNVIKVDEETNWCIETLHIKRVIWIVIAHLAMIHVSAFVRVGDAAAVVGDVGGGPAGTRLHVHRHRVQSDLLGQVGRCSRSTGNTRRGRQRHREPSWRNVQLELNVGRQRRFLSIRTTCKQSNIYTHTWKPDVLFFYTLYAPLYHSQILMASTQINCDVTLHVITNYC